MSSSSDSASEDDEWYFSVSVWSGRDLLANKSDGTSSPYVLLKYGDQEQKTRVASKTRNPVWKGHVMFVMKTRQVELYVFDFEDYVSDDVLGKVTVELPENFEDNRPTSILDHEWLPVEPCPTSEQDKLVTFKNLRRSVTKALHVFHDEKHLYKKQLGEICVSVTAFRLDELPALVRERELVDEKEEVRSQLEETKRNLAVAESERDALKIKLLHVKERGGEKAGDHGKTTKDDDDVNGLSLAELRERIQQLTYAYYWKLRQDPSSSPPTAFTEKYSSLVR